MNHTEARPHLEALVEGARSGTELGNDVIREVQLHASGCVDCGETIATLWLLDGRHPSPERIVEFALRSEPFAAGERRSIEWHIELCDACNRGVAGIHEAEEARRSVSETSFSPRRAPATRGIASWTPLAAGIALAVLVAPYAYRGLVTLPGVESQLRNSERTAADAVEALERSHLETEQIRSAVPPSLSRFEIVRQPHRDAGIETTLRVNRSSNVTTLALAFAIDTMLDGEQRVQLTIRDAHGKSLHSTTSSVGALRDLLTDRSGLLWHVPTTALTPGRVRILLTVENGPALLDTTMNVEDRR